MARLRDLKKTYGETKVAQAVKIDPTKNNKYVEWMLKSGEPMEKLGESIKFFHENAKRMKSADIYQYKTFIELKSDIERVGESKRAQEKAAKESAIKLYEDSDWLVVFPSDKAAAVLYGKGTRWCINSDDRTDYEEYVSCGTTFYFVISKKDAKSKFCLSLGGEDYGNDNFFGTKVPQGEAYTVTDSSVNFGFVTKKVGKSAKKIGDAVLAHWSAYDERKHPLYRLSNSRLSTEERKRLIEWVMQQPNSTVEYLLSNGDLKVTDHTDFPGKMVAAMMEDGRTYMLQQSINSSNKEEARLARDAAIEWLRKTKPGKSANSNATLFRRRLFNLLPATEKGTLYDDPDSTIRTEAIERLTKAQCVPLLLDANKDVAKLAAQKVALKDLRAAIKAEDAPPCIRTLKAVLTLRAPKPAKTQAAAKKPSKTAQTAIKKMAKAAGLTEKEMKAVLAGM
jgi:hypothetical protein